MSVGTILQITTGVVCGSVFGILGILTVTYSFNDFLMAEWLNMRPGLPKYELWKNSVVDVTFKVYIFNVTNGDDFLSGKDTKLRLEEVGPITYFEKRQHTDVVFHENSTLSYTSSMDLVFPEHLNEPGILNKTITVVNLISLVKV